MVKSWPTGSDLLPLELRSAHPSYVDLSGYSTFLGLSSLNYKWKKVPYLVLIKIIIIIIIIIIAKYSPPG